MKYLYTFIAVSFLLVVDSTYAQEVLFAEDFNDCSLPADWTTNQEGNPDGIWFVGQPTNGNSDGSTIDGSCMLIFDDDATGQNTPAWNIELLSPAFDATGWSTVQLSMDVHFRNYNGSASMEVIVFDGNEIQTVSLFQGAGAQTGEQFSAFITITTDLSFFANPNMRIGIRYDDGNDWAWWAGIDNIRVTGSGTATPVLLENFNGCTLPDGWISQMVGGEAPWQFGLIEGNTNTGGVTSMNGSCFAFFDDDGNGQDAIPSRAVIMTPVIDGLAYANYYLEMDVILRRYTDSENLSIGIYNEATGQISWVTAYLNDLGGPNFNQTVHEVLDLSAYRQAQMRVVFLYDDGNDWGWWVGIDNIKVLGEGVANDICTNAVDLSLGSSCVVGNNRNTLYTGEDADCSEENEGGLWYRFEATADQLVELRTNAKYNDAITVFRGTDCTQLQQVNCTNYDAFGFTGEHLFWQAEANATYYVRVAGHIGEFGVPRGAHCIELLPATGLPEGPPNDWCSNAQFLTIGEPCIAGTNVHANYDGPLSSRNDKSKADIWYTFQPTTDAPLEVLTNADFADVITVFAGDCDGLEELATQELGQRLLLENVTAGATYLLQISGYFATVEGSLCLQVNPVVAEAPDNVLCATAIELTVDGACVEASNTGAEFSGPAASCAIFQDASIWFQFEAPGSGRAVVKTNADFVHAVSAYAGPCENLEEIACVKNPNPCGQSVVLNGLEPGQVYWLRLSSMRDLTGLAQTGNSCVQVLDGDNYEPTPPLSILGYTECYDNGTAKLVVDVSGGMGHYDLAGNFNGEILQAGASYFVLATDEQGCQTSITGIVDCIVACTVDAQAVVLGTNSCPNDNAGGIQVDVTGGSGNYEYVWQDGSVTAALEGIPSGYYTVTVTDLDNGCSIAAGGLVDGPLPYNFEILNVLNATEEEGGAIEISFSGGTPPYLFDWLSNGELVSNDQNPTGLPPGFYDLLVTDADGCIFSYTGIEIQSPTATADAENWIFFNLYPNPTKGRTYLEWETKATVMHRVSVLTASGQEVDTYQLGVTAVNPFPIDLDGMPSGVYFIRCQTNKGVITKRLVLAE